MKAENCPTCGKSIDGSALMGLCPECLLKAGFGTIDTEGKAAPFVAPSPADLARYFPELEIRALIGQGGMGAVYEARQTRLDRVVALKILPPEVERDEAFGRRFEREAKALAQLHHPNIVTLYESGQKEGLFYFLMEFVDGMNLRQLLDTGHVSPKEALAIVPQICDALQFAHDRGIIHRDIKPENILLNQSGQVKIADFGVARLIAREQSEETGNETPAAGQTAAGAVIGTPQYMAPEQISHPQQVDNRADIYALGVVFYQMLTGEMPAGKFEPPSRKVQIDVRLDEIVLRAMEKNPELRFPQASLLKTHLETVVANVSPPAPETPPIPEVMMAARKDGAAKIRFATVAILVASLLALFGVVRWYKSQPPGAQAATSANLARSQYPLCENNLSDKNSALVYHDKVDLDYALYYEGAFGASGSGSHNTHSLSWIDEGSIRLANGRTFGYLRESVSELSLKVNGEEFDLRKGRVIVLKNDGTCEQLDMFPTLSEALNRTTLARLIANLKNQTNEPPKLRFLAWQEKTTDPLSPHAWTPDGRWADDQADIRLLRASPATRVNVSETSFGAANPRFLFLWFSSPGIDLQSYSAVELLDAEGKPLALGGGGSTGSGASAPDDSNGELGWITYTLSPGSSPAIPAKVTVRLKYSAGPWMKGSEIESDFRGSMALRDGAYLNGFGQGTDGKAFVPLSIDRTQNANTQFDFVALTRDGRTLASSRSSTGGPTAGPLQIQRFEFNAPLGQIKSFQMRTREIRTETYPNIPLMPD